MTLDLLSIGEAMAEIREDDAGTLAIGFAGDTFNTAVYFKRSSADNVQAAYMTRIGDDPLSRGLLNFADALGIDMSPTPRNAERNLGIYAVSTDANGERSFSYWRSASAARALFSDASDIAAMPPARIVFLSGITLAIMGDKARNRLHNHLVNLRKAGDTLFAFDSNYRTKLWPDEDTARATISAFWDIADIALPSIDDEMALRGHADEKPVIDWFSARSWTACAIKRGARGPLSPTLETGGHPDFPPAQTVVDTTSAGDAFNGAFLAAFSRGEPIANCLSAGHELASIVVGHRGAII